MMHIWKVAVFVVLTAVGTVMPVRIAAQATSGQTEWLRQAELSINPDLGNIESLSFSAFMEFIVEKPGEERTVERARIYTRSRADNADAMDDFLILFTDPAMRRGEGYLSIGENSWFYDPESREFAHFSLEQELGDGDSTGEDFTGRSLLESYTIESVEEGRLGAYDVYRYTLSGINDTITYPQRICTVRRDQPLILKEENYSVSGRLINTRYFLSFTRVDGILFPSRTLYVDNLNEGERTTNTLSEVSFDPIPNSVFTQAFLERANR